MDLVLISTSVCYQKFPVTNYVVFYCFLYLFTSVLWCSWIIFVFNLLFLRTYTFLFFNITSFSSYHSLFLNTFNPVCFISSIAFITLLSFAFDFFIFSIKSTSLIITSSIYITLISIYSFFINTLSLLFLFTFTCQFGFWLKLFTLFILLPDTCFKRKSNLDRYKAYAYLWFNFWLFIKYSRFLWSLQILNLFWVSFNKYLYSSKYLTIASIFQLWIL